MTDHLWNLTNTLKVLREDDFMIEAEIYLKSFEEDLLRAMNKDGWDGEEDATKVRWTFEGALFYSIIVITTIGKSDRT